MIGDSYAADIQGAINAGIDQVYYPLDGLQKDNQPATYFIRNLSELKQWL